MPINDTISQAAATSPYVGSVVSTASVNSAILAGIQTGDPAQAALLGAVSGQAGEENELLSSLSAGTSSLGQHLDASA